MIYLPITSYFAVLLTLIFIALAVRVIQTRRRHQMPIGDGGITSLNYAIRAHGNFVEYSIWYLLLLALCELQHAVAPWLLIITSSAFVLARLSHAYSLLYVEQRKGKFDVWFRVAGMVGSFICLMVLVVGLMF